MPAPSGGCSACALGLQVLLDPLGGGGWLAPVMFNQTTYVPQWSAPAGGMGVLSYNDYDEEGILAFNPASAGRAVPSRHTLLVCERTTSAAPAQREWYSVPDRASVFAPRGLCAPFANITLL